MEQRSTMRNEGTKKVIEGAYLAEVSKGKEKISYCESLQKTKT